VNSPRGCDEHSEVQCQAVCTGGVQGEQLVLPHMPNVNSSSSGAVPVHVVSFGKMVDVFSSKQRPKKLIIYGDDFK